VPVCVRRIAVLVPTLLAFWPSASGGAAAPCWERLLHDWRANGRIDRTYPISCYRDTTANLPEDLRQYSTASEDIRRAMLHAVARGAPPPAPPAAGSGSSGALPLKLLAVVGASLGLALLLSAVGRTLWSRTRRRRLGSAE
jgi:hypothetical protein